MRIAITGAAGLVAQNLILRLKARGGYEIVGIDKHAANARILRELHPDIRVVVADLARPAGGSGRSTRGGVVVATPRSGGCRMRVSIATTSQRPSASSKRSPRARVPPRHIRSLS